MANTENCPIYEQEGECYEDIHHAYWPSKNYKTKLEKEFRQLDDNKYLMCRFIHNSLHAVTQPPQMPGLEVMRRAVGVQRKNRA